MQSGSSDTQSRAQPGKYLTFTLADETYGMEIRHVREIIALAPITTVPNAPRFIKGVINLRGKIIAVVDLCVKFRMSRREYGRETCIVMVDVAVKGGRLLLGVIVDSVKDVIDVSASEVEGLPAFGVRVDTSFLLGLARARNSVFLLLDIEKVLSHEELEAAESAGSAPGTRRAIDTAHVPV
jgi:purine-binding chemotaxis protein CheW